MFALDAMLHSLSEWFDAATQVYREISDPLTLPIWRNGAGWAAPLCFSYCMPEQP
jgi:hypothetical protein